MLRKMLKDQERETERLSSLRDKIHKTEDLKSKSKNVINVINNENSNNDKKLNAAELQNKIKVLVVFFLFVFVLFFDVIA